MRTLNPLWRIFFLKGIKENFNKKNANMWSKDIYLPKIIYKFSTKIIPGLMKSYSKRYMVEQRSKIAKLFLKNNNKERGLTGN